MNELIKVYSEIPSSIAKADLIAGEETIKAAVYFTNELDAARIKLSAKRYPLEALKNQIDSLSQELKISLESDDRIIEAMKQALFNGVSDRVRFQKMYRILEYERNRIPETIKQRSILAADLFAKQMSFYAECAPVFARLNTLVMPILIAMRKELGLPISENIYVQAYEQNPGIFREPMKEFEENFEQFITTQFGAVEEQH